MESVAKKSILIVDDDPVNIMHLTEILGDEYVLFAAKDGITAIKKAQERLPNLILLDIIMPNMTGYEVLEQLKAFPTLKEIPIIFITGLDEREDAKLAPYAETVDFISKPFKSEVVKQCIANQLEFATTNKV